ncbi:DUF6441 family protein, partial [Emcibacteraceae bacterium Y4]
MRLKAALEGNLDAYLKKELLMGERAVTKAVRQATSGLKQSMRSQVVASGLGPRLARTWRGDVYPRRGESLKAAGLVYTKAQKIMEGFEEGQVIRAKDG